MKTKLGIKIGADPEFAFSRNGRFVPAHHVLGYDTNSELGTDGRDDTAELRPKPGSYYQVNSTISKLLSDAKKFGYDAYAGSGDHAPLGGHIHFSGIAADRELVKRLDKFIARPLNTVSDRSARHHYGEYGEVRSQDHGWEYRAPLSWLSTPILTKGTLAIAWVLARAYKFKQVETINAREDLLNYAYKGERIAISLFFDAIKNYKTNNIQLESIEMFAAWGKESKPKPSHFPDFSDDEFVWDIRTYILNEHSLRKTAGRYHPYFCYKRLRFYGVRNSRSQEKAVFTETRFEGNHIGAKLLPGDGEENSIGLSYNLRKDKKQCAWVIKRIIKLINEQYERSL